MIRKTIEKYGEENFYISFSGGKDSTVLHHLIDEAIPGNKIPRVFINTGIEPIDYIESHNLNFNLGNVIKYVSRAPFKGTELEDLKKAKWYLEREIKKHER